MWWKFWKSKEEKRNHKIEVMIKRLEKQKDNMNPSELLEFERVKILWSVCKSLPSNDDPFKDLK